MRQVLQGERCVAEIFAEAYRLQTSASSSVEVVKSCGGCPMCRAAGRTPYAGPLPEPLPPWPVSRDLGEPLAQLFAGTDAVAIFYDEVETYAFERFVRWLVAAGIRSAVLPPELSTQLRAAALEILAAPSERPVFVSDTFHFRRAPRVPTLIVHPAGAEVPFRYLPSSTGDGIPRLLFLPTGARDPDGPHRRLRDVIPRKFSFSEFLLSRGL